jgi:2-polyprenyl-3-methyl-5-hydroxy-6-metoxy-1,4-benzoquinol methylase
VTRCWVCHSTETTVWKIGLSRPLHADDLKITDHRYGTTLSLRRCQTCGFIFAVGDVDDVARLYRQLDDPGYLDSGDTRRLQMAWLLDHVLDRHPEIRSLLDVGAGTGLLVDAARRRGLNAIGIEPSRALTAHANQSGIPVIEGILPHAALEDRAFDLVTLVDVIEHVPQPVDLLRRCAGRLTPTGFLVVVTPDITSVPARLMGKRWWHYRLAHIGYFSPRSLAAAAEQANLVIAETFSARWFFRLRYVAERVGQYLPVQTVNRVADRLGPLRRLYERTLAFDLHDSIGVVLRSTRAVGHETTTKVGISDDFLRA